MNRERFQEAKRIYNSALEREPHQREAYLKEACAGDEALRKEVESLLAFQSEAKEFFKAPAIEAGANALANDPHVDLTGRTLLHYSITEKIGEGGMGVVYKARNLHLDRSVAINVLPPEAVADPERKRRFLQEAKAASGLNHPNIIQVYDINSDGGVDFIAMEHIAGRTLDRHIGRRGLPLGDALKYAVQIADALAAAHAAGIVHRDVKPANVIVTEKGFIRVLDFGLAKLTQPMPSDISGEVSAMKSLTEEGRIMGTVAYLSPEQAEGKPVDARSDIFSFGSVLYEMVTGRRAFQGDSNLSTLSAILKQEPVPCGPGIPADLEEIISRCLHKDPARRFQYMADVKVELEELREQTEPGHKENGVPVSPALGRKSAVWGALSVLVILAAIGIFYFLRRASREAPAIRVIPLTSYRGSAILPTFSPDGNHLAHVSCPGMPSGCDVYLLELGSDLAPRAPPPRVTDQRIAIYGLSWTSDSQSVVYAASLCTYTGPFDLWRVDSSATKVPVRIDLAGLESRHPAIARGSRRLVCARHATDSDIWRYQIGRHPESFIASRLIDDHPQFSPDERRSSLPPTAPGGAGRSGCQTRTGKAPFS